MAWSKCVVLLAALLVSSVASETTARQELGEGVKQACTMCCRVQRNADRLCDRVEQAEGDLAEVLREFRIANRAVRSARAAFSENNDRIAMMTANLSATRLQIFEIRTDIVDGGESSEEVAALRAQIMVLRGVVEELRSKLAEALEMRDTLLQNIEDAASDLGLAREDAVDERVMLRRAEFMKSRAVMRLNRCLGITPTPEPTEMEATPMP